MKTTAIGKYLLMAILIGSCSLITAQTPFSDKQVQISQESSSTGSDHEKPGFWQRLGNKIKQGYQKLTGALNNVLTDDRLPSFVSRSAMIPGHETREFVCQGICYLPEKVISPASEQLKPRNYRYAVLSYYPEPEYTDEPTQLVVIDISTGKPLRRIGLYLADGTPYTGHAGGIAAAGQYLWVASGFKIHGFEVQSILDFLNDKTAAAASSQPGIPKSLHLPAIDLTAARTFEVDSTASYVSFDGTQLWVGDFIRSSNKSFAAVKHHARNPFKMNTWIAGYKVDASGMPTATQKYTFRAGDKSRTAHKPDRLIFCRESVQGMAICGKYAALSISYGALNAKLALYSSPLGQPGQKITFKPEGQTKTFSAEGWVLADGVNWLKTVELPAGSEDLEFDGRYLYVTFEGASQNYRQKWISINPLIRIENRFYLIKTDLIMK